MRVSSATRWLMGAAFATAIVGIGMAGATPAFAESHGSGGKGSSQMTDGVKGHKGQGGSGTMGRGGGSMGKGSLRDVFNEMEEESATDHQAGSHETGTEDHGGSDGTSKGSATKGSSTARGSSTTHGTGRPADRGSATAKKGSGSTATPSEEEDSDRPDYAGQSGREGKPGRPNTESGTKKGTLYGDMYVIARDESGLPILDENGYVQVKYVDADGNLTCCVLRDAEGNLLPTLADGTAVTPIEVELGRLSVGRSPTRVLAAQYEEAINSINTSTSVSLDASGRIVLTLADGTLKTIDSPLENLALYVELLNTGTLGGLDASKLGDLSYLVDGTLTAKDLQMAASFFAAASDKTIPVTIDSIEYMNSILGIDGTLASNYVDYAAFTYDRQTVYGSMTVEALVAQPDGSYLPTTINVYDTIFKSQPTGELTNVSAFTTATDDARAVIDFLHEYEVPAAVN